MKLTRREVLAGAVAGAVGVSGIYELVDKLAGSTPVRAATGAKSPEQHLLNGIRVVRDNGVEVLVPPLHHEIVTARVAVGKTDLRDAQATLEKALGTLDDDYAASPTGLGVTLAWGLPYFSRYVPSAAARYLPKDRRAGGSALLPARRFQSDPVGTVLESNDVAILLRSDTRQHIEDAISRIRGTKVFEITSLRRGFAGGGFDGTRSLPKQMALAVDLPGADLIPETSELFLGFTSTQKAGMGPGEIANFETLGIIDLRGSDYFRRGTHMHLSHVTEDLEAWYINFDFQQRVDSAFRPNLRVRNNAQTVRQGPQDVSTESDVLRDYHQSGAIGHSAALQTTTRLQKDAVGPDGTHYPKGSAIPIRADFNTLDNPFYWSEQPSEIGSSPMAGIHFIVFNPSSDDFHRNREAMDGILPGDVTIKFPPRDRNQGFNSILRTTHRQNFLVPPRVHRSFPLAEL
jgi:hypothetical protein